MPDMPNILVVEDDPSIGSMLRRGLTFEGFDITPATTGPAALEILRFRTPDLIILDVMLPGLDGFEVCRRIRAAGIDVPVLMLTAREEVSDRVAGLNAGADDYLVKPFAFSELSARLQALVRRPPLAPRPARYRVGDLEIDTGARRVERAGRVIELTPHEYRLLERLAQNAGHAVTRAMLLETLWGFQMEPRANLIDAHVSRLRAKIDRGFDAELIRTIRGVGYVLEAPR